MKERRDILAGIPNRLPEEVTDVLAEGEGVRIERIVSTGHASPPGFWYDQDWDEWVVVLAGSGCVEFRDGERVVMTPGDSLLLRAHEPHRVASTSEQEPTVWLAVHCQGGLGGIEADD